ncbi:MAG: TM2 domain-containing protein [Ruminococcus sp.]|nr:TM2 domain-containing protein [Ruminococcus sp.]
MKCPYCGAETVSRKCEYCNSDLSEQYMNNGTIGGAVSGAINNIGQSIANNISNIPNNINRNNNPNNFPNNNPNFPNNYQNMSNAQPQIVQNIIIGQNPQPQPQPRFDVSPKNKTLAMILCIVGFFGCGGLHRFYTGHILSGILWICTGGLGGIGTVIDLLLLLSNSFKDKNGLKLLPEEKL